MRLCSLLAAILFAAGCGPAPSSSATERVTESAVTLPDYITLSPDNIKFRRGDLALNIVPSKGGRISSLRFAGKERLITERDTEGNNWGSVLWPSPQKNWGWPPPATLDSDPYQLSVTDAGVRLTSAVDPDLQVSFSKHYRLGDISNTLVVNYRITSHADQPITLAPWEITRLPAAGSVFFPTGETPPIKGQFAPLPLTAIDNVSWFDYPVAGIGPDNHKLMTDGEEGWLAYHNNDWLLVKAFSNVPAQLMAPGEGEIEVYANGENTYIELEQQGFLTTLMPGQTLQWQVIWLCDRAAPNATREALIKRARTLAGRARTL
ncbi:DUF4380 domain-containing protein [Gilvimarinus polysaccharolyticus]|uniref:DUF4380 domain-containing protein n=1 Tax=Gilvimarinus polysaccharolyticus TaxID=863921 RepID=UPI0006734FCE|nr:DUF4380 domain-containing protein [Gilvimarinus polysaccharolyticus]